ncbi:MAG: UDP-N-acetylglucosamine 1-carboxyvinyltransferase, partial [Candidatus Paceibacterota bacterium]
RISAVLERDLVNLSEGSLSIQINGGKKLSGTIPVKTSKNAAVALLAASLLNKSTTTLKRVPKIEEVHRLIEVLKSIGVSVVWNNGDLTITPPEKLSLSDIDAVAAGRTRSIILFIGALLHRSKRFRIPQAAGCKLGARTIKPHLYALEELGVSITTKHDNYTIEHKGLSSGRIVLYESGDTVTENVLMAAALTPGTTTIRYASANYQVQDLCYFLETLGVKIEGIGTTTLVVHGIKEINTPVEYHLSEDPIEAMFFIAAAAVTRSAIKIERCPIDFLELELLTLEKMGFKYTASKRYKAANGKTDLVDIKTRPSRLIAPSEKIHPRPYPGLNIDNLPFFAVIATQAEGQTFIHDWVFENRAIYYKELDKLGADTILGDQHRFYVTGPTKLKAQEIVCPPALRPAAIILIAMLAAEGTSTLRNIYSINRGYEDLVKRLNSLGADIHLLRSV